jgi:hypothetical protein
MTKVVCLKTSVVLRRGDWETVIDVSKHCNVFILGSSTHRTRLLDPEEDCTSILLNVGKIYQST